MSQTARRPRGLYWSQFEVGQVYESEGRTVESGDVSLFAGLSGDFNPLHLSETFAQKTPFKTRVAHGMLTVSISTGQQNQMGIFEGTALALLGLDEVRLPAAVRFGDTIRTVLEITSVRATSKPERGIVGFSVTVLNQRDEPVATYKQSLMVVGESA
jgi:3-hydroxybutyryl-CoA dehydratase